MLSSLQHGFVPGKSTLSNLFSVTDLITSSLDKGKNIDVIYLDFQKAFDKISHKILITKMISLGIDISIVFWVQEFLRDRTQVTIIRGKCSSRKPVLSGVSQGSVLGPVLFVIYINELLCIPFASCVLAYADDTKLCNIAENSQELQMDLNNVSKWAASNSVF